MARAVGLDFAHRNGMSLAGLWGAVIERRGTEVPRVPASMDHDHQMLERYSFCDVKPVELLVRDCRFFVKLKCKQ